MKEKILLRRLVANIAQTLITQNGKINSMTDMTDIKLESVGAGIRESDF